MFTKSDIHAQLAAMGVLPADTVLMYTSMKAVGEVEGRAQGFLDILIDYFADDGLLLIPTHTWKNLEDLSRPTMDMTSDYTCIGLLPSLAAAHPAACRSLHPTHSMAAFGKKAAAYIADEIHTDTSTHPAGCYGKLYEAGGKILLCGVGHNRNTYLHSCEERIGVPNRLSKDLRPSAIRLASGEILPRPIHCHHAEGCSDVSAHYPKYEPAFRRAGAVTDGFIGNAPAQFCDCIIMCQVMERIHLAHPAELCFDDEPLPEELLG
ncbi:MAG: AAC(3) family N-acetyltransferase [Clostridia bacterium]|nr:AAC(3) family N-acetyltransferase [Clostridia bacterium]